MNSIGISEGTVIRSKEKCMCVWGTLTSLPPKFKLIKKCKPCIQKENGVQGNKLENHELYKVMRYFNELDKKIFLKMN